MHHIHHLCSRIPFYRLPTALRDHPALATVGRVTLVQSLGCVRLALWDETTDRLISFQEMQAIHGDPKPALIPASGRK
jgi:omega-6 fatty acid desaturase (delta-12 desaturase)